MKCDGGLQEKVLAFAREHRLWEKGNGILAAVSGGPDSMGLLLFLKEIEQSESLRIGCCTVQHHLRAEAEEETEYVRALCETLSIPFYRVDVDVRAAQARGLGSTETAARALRYEALLRIQKEKGYDVIATAHHADDQAETILFHVLRGSGAKGLSGMRPRNGRVIRPFLSVMKKEIEDFLSHFPYRSFHDATNDEWDADRNRIRGELMPQLLSYNPQLVRHLLHMGDIFREEDAYLDGEARRWIEAYGGGGEEEYFLSRKDFLALPVALARRVLLLLADHFGEAMPDFDGIERMRHLAAGRSGARTSAAGLVMEVGAKDLYFYQGNTTEGKGERPLVRLYSHYVKFVKKQVDYEPTTDIIGSNSEEICPPWRLRREVVRVRPHGLSRRQFALPYEAGRRLHLRLATKEDEMLPSGMAGRKSVYRLLQEAGISPSARPLWPLLADGDEVYWLGFLRGREGSAAPTSGAYMVFTLSWME